MPNGWTSLVDPGNRAGALAVPQHNRGAADPLIVQLHTDLHGSLADVVSATTSPALPDSVVPRRSGMAVVGPDGTVLRLDPALADLLRGTRRAAGPLPADGERVSDWLHPQERRALPWPVSNPAQAQASRLTLLFAGPGLTRRPAELEIWPSRGPAGLETSFVVRVTVLAAVDDGEALRAAEAAAPRRAAVAVPSPVAEAAPAPSSKPVNLVEQALEGLPKDPLTGLFTREALGIHLAAAHARMKRFPGRHVALLLLDLDGFKPVNDRLGHAAGDELLRQVAVRLRHTVRAHDLVVRLGGDEFVLLLVEEQDLSGAKQVAERVRAVLSRPFPLPGRAVQVGASIGISRGETTDIGLDRLLADADLAMYASKHAGRNRFTECDDLLRNRRDERIAIEDELRIALARDQLVLYYQPLVDLETGCWQGVEALVRWQHPTRGLLLPGKFLPTLIQAGLEPELGRWVMRTATRDAATWWPFLGDSEFSVGFNLGATELADPATGDMLLRLLRQPRPEGCRFTVEITETSLMKDGPVLNALLSAARERGALLALDDFGTGWSSFAYLSTMPVDTLKLDRRFIVGAAHNSRDLAVCRSVITLADELGLRLVAEGIETSSVADTARELGVRIGQGFHLQRPAPYDRILGGLVQRGKGWSSRRSG